MNAQEPITLLQFKIHLYGKYGKLPNHPHLLLC